MSADADRDNPVNDHVYVGNFLGRCFSCTAIAREQDKAIPPNAKPGEGPAHPQALHFGSSRVHRQPMFARSRRLQLPPQ